MLLAGDALITQRLILRNLSFDDAEGDYYSWMHDKEVVRYHEIRHVNLGRDDLRRYIKNMNESSEDLLLAICLLESKKHIGNIRLGPIDKRNNRADLGLLIGDKDCWGKGYATEAIKKVTAYAFGELNLHRVEASAYAINEGSLKAFQKVGYEIEGCLTSHWLTEDGYVDEILVGIVRDEH